MWGHMHAMAGMGVRDVCLSVCGWGRMHAMAGMGVTGNLDVVASPLHLVGPQIELWLSYGVCSYWLSHPAGTYCHTD